MPWIKLDDHFDEHPKVAAAGPLGIALWVSAIAYSNRNLTDGFVPTSVAQRLIDCRGVMLIDHYDKDKLFEESPPDPWYTAVLAVSDLVQAGLFEETSGGYRIHDYDKFQPSKAEVMEERRKWADKKRSQRGNTQSNGESPRDSTGESPRES
jgi:hypothetical protein